MRGPNYRVLIAVFSLASLVTNSVLGQDYPNKPVRIVTSGVGGGQDIAARLIAQGLTELPWTQPVIVDNRTSALASELVAKAPPDGHVLSLVAGNLWVGPLLQKMPYDPVKDFLPIMLVGKSTNVLVVHPLLPVNSVKELVALAKARPGELNYGSSSIGGTAHLAAELFQHMAGVRIVRINYKTSGQVTSSLVGGHIQMTFGTAGVTTPQLKSGRLKALGITTAEPSPMFPGVPPIAATLPGYEAAIVYAMFAPAGTPSTVINRVNQDVIKVLNRSDTKEKLFNAGIEAAVSSPEQAAAYIKSDMSRMDKVIKSAGIRLE